MVPYKLMRLLLFVAAAMACEEMEVKYGWVYVDYTFPSPQDRQSAIDSKSFIPENCVILDVDSFQYTDSTGDSPAPPRVFVTNPRILPGIPATVAELVPESNSTESSCTLLSPYPNWEANTVLNENSTDCEKTIISVFRIKIDVLGRLWILDVGTLDQFAPTHRSVCAPKVLIYDLKNGDQLIKVYPFTSSHVKDHSLFTNLVIDIKDPTDGTNTFAYIADTTAYKLVVYDFKNDDSWVVDQAYFYPYPTAGSFLVDDVHFCFMDGVLGLALSPQAEETRLLYFHSYTSVRESWVETSVLQNKSMFQSGLIDGADVFSVSEEARDAQSTVQVMTDDGILIFASMENSLVAWNSKDSFTEDNLHVVYKDDELFQFPTGMKIIGDKVWAVSSQLHHIISPDSNTVDLVKYRVLVGNVSGLLKCAENNWFPFSE